MDLLDEIESETLYFALVTVDRRTLQIVVLKMQGYSTKEIAPLVHFFQEVSRMAYRVKAYMLREESTAITNSLIILLFLCMRYFLYVL